jgi:hypothetical protein
MTKWFKIKDTGGCSYFIVLSIIMSLLREVTK